MVTFPVRVRLPDNTEATWTIMTTEQWPWKVVVRSKDGREWSAEADDLFSAFQKIRRTTDEDGVKICVNGARRDAYPSGMSRDMGGGRMLYVLRPRRGIRRFLIRIRPRRMVFIFDPAPCHLIGTVDEQDRHFEEWIGGAQ